MVENPAPTESWTISEELSAWVPSVEVSGTWSRVSEMPPGGLECLEAWRYALNCLLCSEVYCSESLLGDPL